MAKEKIVLNWYYEDPKVEKVYHLGTQAKETRYSFENIIAAFFKDKFPDWEDYECEEMAEEMFDHLVGRQKFMAQHFKEYLGD